jgi:hypothetical protein
MALCVARTFLSAGWRNDGTACCDAKVRNYQRFECRLVLMIIFIRQKRVQVAGCWVINPTFTLHHAPCNFCPMRDIDINDFDYDLPADRIAQYPVSERDESQLLVYRNKTIINDTFNKIDEYLPPDSLLIFNNTRVIRARILFKKKTGAIIEVLCLEPLSPVDYALSFSSKDPVVWKCIVGNLKKWKSGILETHFNHKGSLYSLCSEKIKPEGEAWQIKFRWNCTVLTFG